MKLYKSSFIKIICLSTALFFASCNETLDLQPVSEIGADGFYKNAEEVNLAVIGIYSSLHGIQNREWMLTEVRSDNTYMNPNSTETKDLAVREIDRFVQSSQNVYLKEYWQACYRTINLSNVVLKNLDVVSDPALRNKFEGEARFLRAHAYFNLVRLWGGVFIVTEPVSGLQAKTMDRSPQSEVYAFIINDLRMASEMLPPTQGGASLGRVAADAAKTLLGKALLTAGGDDNLDEAKTVLEEVVSGNFGLQPTYASVFSLSNEYNNEILFAVRYQSGSVGLGSPHPNFFAPLQSDNYVVFGNGDGLNVPTESMSNAYGVSDPRKAPSMADTWLGFNNAVRADRHVTKYNSPFNAVDDGGSDWIVLRYADALLLLAEAINQKSGPTPEALGYLNEVRTRSLGASVALTMSQVATYFDFKVALEKERRLEFGFENHRWFDLVRTGRAEAVMSQHFATEFQYNDPAHPSLNTGALQHYQILLPIPQYEIDLNPNIAQNTGY
ncbi:RagB/SusD family nutrient uptake outer membrane protein [uncultured Flavobacterium sp.]|uniref:RagB/SusD family nutrient uptake outer membrane protein n=1 Tax=uncultured Flavobacterium sp. TaxID=165435 RepID=UPI0025F184EC|nr:RagB/SusD family nutrient uptake outer membrane protein [uncultured Flavobacterium sp.]